MSYAAIVAPISVRKHPNADKLQLGVVNGNQVVVGLDVADGQLGVFFPTDGQLSHAMCVNNDLYSASARAELGLPATEKPGFFSTKRRVRSQKFRGEKSDGFWCELDKLAGTGADLASLKAGDTFTELNGYAVCNRYETEATKRAKANGANKPKKKARILAFPPHVDSPQFRNVWNTIPDGSIIYISEKLHGTSGRFGHVRETVPNGWVRRLLRLNDKAVWGHFNGSRNVVLEQTPGTGYYGTNEFRYRATENLTLHKGEIIYFELVGWVSPDKPIMSPQPIADKALRKEFGPVMTYAYGTTVGGCQLFVYRITRLNEDGVVTELSQYQMEARTKELGLQTVPVLRGPWVKMPGGTFIREAVEQLTEGVSTRDARHIREGVVVRIEQPDGTIRFVKNKSFDFGVLEGYIKDDESIVDMEEAA